MFAFRLILSFWVPSGYGEAPEDLKNNEPDQQKNIFKSLNYYQMEEFNKLQKLCDVSNRRYRQELNTDDQDKKIINFCNKNTNVCLLIGYDDYNAIKTDEVIKHIKENSLLKIIDEKDGFSYVEINHKRARIKTELINTFARV